MRKTKFLIFMKYTFITIKSITVLAIIIILFKYGPSVYNLTKDAETIIHNISEDDFKTNANSHVFDSEGNEIFDLVSEKDTEYLVYDKIPKDVINAFVSVEDKRFWEHSGVDFQALLRAAQSLVHNKGEITQGGSTITQQLVKLTYLSSEQSFSRKYKEILIARALEKEFSKEQIISFYVNDIYFGNNVYGINAASYEYFGEPVGDLSLSQIATLCAIPNNPSIYDPKVNMDNTLKRRNLILDKMYENGYITQSQLNEAKEETITLADKKAESIPYDTRKDFVIKELAELIMEEDGFELRYNFSTDEEKAAYTQQYTEAFADAKRKIYSRGYKIYTSFDSALQKYSQQVIDSKFSGETEKSSENIYSLQGSAVTIDNKTGLVLSMIGGRTSPVTDYLDRSFNTYRQNGSAMKPIGVYAPAFDILNYVPSTVKNDAKETNGPNNSTGYFGDIRLEKAIQVSSNTVAWKTFRDVTPRKGLEYLKKMKFENIVPADNKLTSALGGLTIGTNPMEMAGAYATLENKGLFNKPSCIVKLEDMNGKVIYTHTNKNERIYKQSTSELITMCMKEVLEWGSNANYKLANNIECAGKTGTTNDYKDGWFVGYSPKYTTSVWIGYDQPKTVSNMYGEIKPLGIWKSIMDYAHKNDKDLSFDTPSAIQQIDINWKGQHVPDGQGVKEWYPKDSLPEKDQDAFDAEGKQEFINKINRVLPASINSIDDYLSAKDLCDSLKEEVQKLDLGDNTKKSLNKTITDKLSELKYNYEHPKTAVIEENKEEDTEKQQEESVTQEETLVHSPEPNTPPKLPATVPIQNNNLVDDTQTETTITPSESPELVEPNNSDSGELIPEFKEEN